MHDGTALSLIAEINQQIVRLTLGAGVYDGQPFAFHVPGRVDARTAWSLLSEVLELLNTPPRRPLRPTARQRPNRSSLNHLRALQAFDGAAAGASHCEIAEVIFGSRDVFERWNTDSELRAQVRYLLRRGQGLVSGGYRQVLGKPRPAR